MAILDDWNEYWLRWKVPSSDRPPYWGPPPTEEEATVAFVLGIPAQPTLEAVLVTASMRKAAQDIRTLKRKIQVRIFLTSIHLKN
jgi:hypothetical protein